jgi:putative PIN family toxin of toxin-antitoxin system
MRLVIDTSVLVAARWVPHGPAGTLLDLCCEGRLTPLLTPKIERENRFILGKVNPPDEFWGRVERFHCRALLVEQAPRLNVCEDPEDDKYLECAVAGQADYIISSDKHLLDHDGYRGIRICKAWEFLKQNAYLKR